ncbi:MAG: hypothetical protein RLZ36_191 [Pseudomonadota bacterium]|jgi:hypothetical protein
MHPTLETSDIMYPQFMICTVPYRHATFYRKVKVKSFVAHDADITI